MLVAIIHKNSQVSENTIEYQQHHKKKYKHNIAK